MTMKTLPCPVIINITYVRPHVNAILIVAPCMLFNLGDCGLSLLYPSFNIVMILFISLGTVLFSKMFCTNSIHIWFKFSIPLNSRLLLQKPVNHTMIEEDAKSCVGAAAHLVTCMVTVDKHSNHGSLT